MPVGWRLPPGVVSENGRFFKTHGDVRTEMVVVFGGPFRPHGADTHVAKDPFLIDRFETTNEVFRAFLAKSPQAEAALKRLKLDPDPRIYGHKEQPRVFITLGLAREFAGWAGKQLPSEAQWECAACWDHLAGKRRAYPWGGRYEDAKLISVGRSPRVDACEKDISPHGARGMGGGVREFCESVSRDPDRGVVRGSTVFTQGRMGSMHVKDVNYRSEIKAGEARANVGFRCVMPLRQR